MGGPGKFLGFAAQHSAEGAVEDTITGDDDSGKGGFCNNVESSLLPEMAEGIIVAGLFYTARMICQAGYKSIKSYREKKAVSLMPATEAYADGCSNDDHRYKESSRSTHGTDKSVYGTNNSAHGQGGGRHDYFRPAFGGESHPPHHHVTPSIPLMGRPPEPHQNQRRSSRGGGQIHGHQSEEHYHHRSNYEEGHLTQSAPYSSTAASAVYSKRAQNGGEAMAPPPWAVTSEAQAGLNGTSAAEMERRITEEDRQWMADLASATERRTRRDNEVLLREIQSLGDRIDNMSLNEQYSKVTQAVKFVLLYQQSVKHGDFSPVNMLEEAYKKAMDAYTHPKSILIIQLSAVRVTIVTSYMSASNRGGVGRTVEPDMVRAKASCRRRLNDALKLEGISACCKKFLSSLNSRGEEKEMATRMDTTAVFNIILEMIASLHVLEPFEPTDDPFQDLDVSGVVMHSLSEFCRRGYGDSSKYHDLIQQFEHWQSSPRNQEAIALRALYNATNGDTWNCNRGWDKILEDDKSTPYGVTMENGCVTKISLGGNNLTGAVPAEVVYLRHLRELALPANKLSGSIPMGLWDLEHLAVVALHGNNYCQVPPPRFAPVGLERRRPSDRAIPCPSASDPTAPKVEVTPLHASKLKVYEQEWFACSWKIVNNMVDDFPENTRIEKMNARDSSIGGESKVKMNSLRPNEEQTVHIMQQAPEYEDWTIDTWELKSDSLDFSGRNRVILSSPSLEVVKRSRLQPRYKDSDSAPPSLANRAYVARSAARERTSFSSFSSHNSV